VSATAPPLDVEEIAIELDRVRKSVIDSKQRAFPKVARQDLENAYGDLCVEALSTSFSTVGELEGWVHRALRRDAIDILRSARSRRETALDPDDEQLAALEAPESSIAGREVRGLLHEFIAGLPEQDRLIAYLHLDPDWDWKPERIASTTGIPVRDVRLSVDRNGSRLRRFVLEHNAGKRCANLARDKLAWIEQGELSRRFKLHLRRCPACRAELRAGRQAVRHALLPQLPAASVPLATSGVLARAHEAAVTHPFALRAQDGMARWRKLVPVGGGGSAAVAAKLAAAGAVVSVTAALHAITHATQRSLEIHPRHARIHHLTIHRLPAITAPTPAAAAPVQRSTITRSTRTHTAVRTTATKASLTYNPPPLSNPLPTSHNDSRGTERTARASSTTGSSGGSASQTTAYAPAPIQSNTSTTSHHSAQSSSSIPGPSGPPAP
jgi:DNA-directed RNA polymerase specialized sigma24 family protein